MTVIFILVNMKNQLLALLLSARTKIGARQYLGVFLGALQRLNQSEVDGAQFWDDSNPVPRHGPDKGCHTQNERYLFLKKYRRCEWTAARFPCSLRKKRLFACGV
jgi:hypothetical protein